MFETCSSAVQSEGRLAMPKPNNESIIKDVIAMVDSDRQLYDDERRILYGALYSSPRYTISASALEAPQSRVPVAWHLNTPIPSPPPCPSIETLAAYVEGSLRDTERLHVSEHLNFCPRCYELVSETREVLRRIEDSRKARAVRDEYRELLLYETHTDFERELEIECLKPGKLEHLSSMNSGDGLEIAQDADRTHDDRQIGDRTMQTSSARESKMIEPAPGREVAYRRGSIMAHCLPARRTPDLVWSRPFGINPYPIGSGEWAEWQRGYGEETERMAAESEAQSEVRSEYDDLLGMEPSVRLPEGRLESELLQCEVEDLERRQNDR